MPLIAIGPLSCDMRDRQSILSDVPDIIAARVPRQIVTLNALMLNFILSDARLTRAVQAAIMVVDSVGIAWAVRVIANVRVPRIPGIDLLLDLCSLAQKRGYTVYLLGAAPGVAERAAQRLQQSYPGLRICGVRHGFFTSAEEASVFSDIRAAAPDILFVGLAIPRQDQWIADNKDRCGAPVVMGIGGSFDVISGDLRRAPRWMRQAGLEWLFRVAQQPWRIARIKALPLFACRVLRIRLTKRT